MKLNTTENQKEEFINKKEIVYPDGYTTDENGIYYSKDGIQTWLASFIEIKADTVTRDGDGHGRLISWFDRNEREHQWAMPLTLLHGSNEHIKYLTDRGFKIIPDANSRNRFNYWLAMTVVDKVITSTDKTGWNGKTYVLPDETFGDDELVFQYPDSFEHCFNSSGSLLDWQANIGKRCIGNSRLVFAVSAAFASCLLTPLEEESAGFHFRGRTSGGKTTTLNVAGSVCGGDTKRRYIRSWRTTSNAIETTAEMHNDKLLCLDELKECSPKQIGEIVYMLANGTGKARMGKSITARKSSNWKLIFLSTGELSLTQMIEQIGQRSYGGQEVRFCDIPADSGSGMGMFENLHEFSTPELFAQALSESSKNFYGTAFREFIRQISQRLDSIKLEWTNFRDEFINGLELDTETPSQVKRVANKFALVAFGGVLAHSICGWDGNESTIACYKVFKDWLSNQSGKGESDTELAISQIRRFIENHQSSRFQNIADSVKISNCAGYLRKVKNQTSEEESLEFLFFPETFRHEVCKGFDSRIVANELYQQGFLKISNERKVDENKMLSMDELKQSVRIKDTTRKLIVIRSKILEV